MPEIDAVIRIPISTGLRRRWVSARTVAVNDRTPAPTATMTTRGIGFVAVRPIVMETNGRPAPSVARVHRPSQRPGRIRRTTTSTVMTSRLHHNTTTATRVATAAAGWDIAGSGLR